MRRMGSVLFWIGMAVVSVLAAFVFCGLVVCIMEEPEVFVLALFAAWVLWFGFTSVQIRCPKEVNQS